MPEPLAFPGQPQPDLDMSDPVVEFITGFFGIVGAGELGDFDALRDRLEALLARRPAPRVPGGLTPAELAQSLVEAAAEDENEGPSLAIDALRLDVLCSDAWTYLGEDAGEEFELAVLLYTLGLMTAQQTLGQEHFEASIGEFWTRPETQPFMRALDGLANACQGLGDLGTAAGHFSLMLELNPQDHQGARHPLVSILLLAQQTDAAGQLLQIYADDNSATLEWARALYTFQSIGLGTDSQIALAVAKAADAEVGLYLTGAKVFPAGPPEDEAELESVTTAMLMAQAWNETEGAMDWLAQQAGAEAPAPVPARPAAAAAAAPPAAAAAPPAAAPAPPAAAPASPSGLIMLPPAKARREGPRSID